MNGLPCQQTPISSVHRETLNAKLALQRASTVSGGLLVYIGDNPGSISCLCKTRGQVGTLDIVKQSYELAAVHDVDLEFIWKPRTTAELQPADMLSRTVDTTDFALHNKLFERLCKEWGFPTAHVFAGQAQKFHKHKK